MSCENDAVESQVLENKPAFENGNSVHKEEILNGISEKKHHKSEHKDKHREKDRDKDRHRSDKDKEKYRHSSSSKSSHKDKERDKERDKDRDKNRDKDRDKNRDKEREKDRDKEKSRDKERHRDEKRSHDKDRENKEHKSSNSSSKDKERSKDGEHRSSKDKHHSSSSSRDKDRDKEKEKDKQRDKDKERREKEKNRHSSSKHSSSSPSKDKDRHREKSKSSHSDHHEKEREKENQHEEVKPAVKEVIYEVKEEKVIEVKREVEENNVSANDVSTLKSEPESEEQDDTADESAADETLQIDENAKQEAEESEDETPLSMRGIKREAKEEDDDEEDTPLFARVKKIKTVKKSKKRKSRADSDEEEDFKPAKKKANKATTREVKTESGSPKKKGKQEEEQNVWKWWEEEKRDDGTKWKFLEHKGPLFAPEYEPLPDNVKFYYDGKEMKLGDEAEEVATFYARMLNHDYTAKEMFNTNFFKDWRKTMTEKEKAIIKDLRKCNFKEIHKHFELKSEERKAMSKDEKKKIKEQNEEIQKEYGFCKIDGHMEKIGNFRIEPPGLFRGRGEHPKMGMHKRRVMPEDVIINCSKDANVPKPPSGHRWKKVQHDPSVTWLASWIENVQGNVKYVMLNPSSKLKGEKDMMKYETARKLAKKIDKIRNTYQEDWKSKEMRIRQRAVALYFIDRLALRAGNEKDEDQADTVGCCSLRVEHVALHEELNGKENVVVFDFLGKDSIRYYNEVPVHKRVFKNLKLFMENKKHGDDLFDRLNTAVLNKHLNELMDGLTAKVFRTYNASITLQNQLNELTNEDDTVTEKILSYNRANRAVAILCNHQRAVPKTHEKSMGNLKVKIEAKKEVVQEAKDELKRAKRSGDSSGQEKARKKLERLKDQLMKLEVQETDREENKTIALGTSKLNYLDPRISVAWCKKYDVPIEKIYNKTQRDKFRWAIDMAGPDYVF